MKDLDPSLPPDLVPGEITDREAYEAAIAEGRIREIPPDSPESTAPPTTVLL